MCLQVMVGNGGGAGEIEDSQPARMRALQISARGGQTLVEVGVEAWLKRGQDSRGWQKRQGRCQRERMADMRGEECRRGGRGRQECIHLKRNGPYPEEREEEEQDQKCSHVDRDRKRSELQCS